MKQWQKDRLDEAKSDIRDLIDDVECWIEFPILGKSFNIIPPEDEGQGVRVEIVIINGNLRSSITVEMSSGMAEIVDNGENTGTELNPETFWQYLFMNTTVGKEKV